jgi:hypothetical protein
MALDEKPLTCNDHPAKHRDWYERQPSNWRQSHYERPLYMGESYARYRPVRRRKIYDSQVLGRDAVIGVFGLHIVEHEKSIIEQQFKELADDWRRQKGPISSVTLKSMIPSYQRIIGLGSGVIPLILKELERQPDHWFYALEMLTAENENPVSDRDAGNIKKMAAAWVRWGKEKGLIQ